MAKILVIDDEQGIRRSLKEIIEFEEHTVDEADNGKDGLEKLKSGLFDAVFCDIKMPKMDGIEVLEKCQELQITTPFIIISGHASINNAVDAIKTGAFDFIEKPLELNRVLVSLRNALDKKDLEEETQILRNKVKRIPKTEMIGDSTAITQIKELIEKVAPTDARVLITGENGTGKELVAKLLHEQSDRAKKPFIEVNCAAIPSELIESELFGHEKGAFTSAVKMKKGKFEQAENGTLFLDEIGDMSHSAQAKVLRALQEQKISRVGSEKDISVNVRILAATNKNLKTEIANGNFREDLYHRLSVILIKVPSLNDRNSDVPLLINYFNSLISREYGISPKVIHEEAIALLKKKDWTGNIRELRNVVERLIILSDSEISRSDVERYV